MKRYVDWEGDLHSFLKIGDLVDEAMVEHFINIVPPATQNSVCIQIGEPYNHIQGKPVFDTLKRPNRDGCMRVFASKEKLNHIQS